MVKALVVVAHPDDETIWCGGTILMHPEWEWAVLCLCRRDDPDRAPKFRAVCKRLKAQCAISDLDDEKPEQKLESLDEVKERIGAMLKELGEGREFDFVFTHGENGEYGHNRHVEVHAAVRQMVEGGELRCKKIFFFSYKVVRSGSHCEPNERGAGVKTALSKQIAREKNLLITSVYEFNSCSFEKRSCSAIETFKVKEK